MKGISAMIICKNEERRIGDCLRSLDFCDEIVVVDSGSTDRTLDIVNEFPVRIFHREFTSWNDQKDFGRAQTTREWVLNIDADEVVSPQLRAELLQMIEEPPSEAAAKMPFRTHFRGLWVKTCGYYPDFHVRFVKREHAYWDRESVHDRVVVNGTIKTLSGHMEHHSFESVNDFIQKSCMYANAFAIRAHNAGKKSGPLSMAIRPLFRFIKAYVFQRGFSQGSLGLMVATLQAYEVFQKYLRLWEMNNFGESKID